MDIYASAALSGLGYSLNNERNTLKDSEYKDAHPNQYSIKKNKFKKNKTGLINNGLANTGGGFPNFRVGEPEPSNGVRPNLREVPSMDNVYSSSYQNKSRATETTLGTNMWKASQTPYETGIVPRPAYASMFAVPEDIPQRELTNDEKIMSLTGEEMTMETFTHNNMQPFYTGNPKQNINVNANSTHFEQMTGTGGFKPHKQAVDCFFQPASGMGNACGFMKNNNEFYMNRIVSPKNQNNTFPIEQVRVGPGLGLGYTSNGEGGFQQTKTLDIVRPKTIDELRSAANQTRAPNKFYMQETGKGITRRGIQAPIAKNRPDRFYEQTPDQLLRTTGANLREMNRPIYDMKPTARVDGQKEYKGSAGYSSYNPGQGSSDDYGKENVLVYNTGREELSERTVITNAMSSVKALIAPLLDLFRDTNKEYTIDAPREFGNMHVQIPSKPTTYDPVNHIMKTTIKETTIHDTTINNLTGKTRGPMSVLDDAKNTVRQSLDSEDTTRNVSGHTYKVKIYNADKMRNTVRQSTDNSGSMYGFMGGDQLKTSAGAYDNIDVVLPDTQKQYVSDYEYEGIAAQKNTSGAYDFIDVDIPDTQKQYISDYEYEGIAGSQTQFSLKSKDAEYNAEIDPTREMLNIKAGYTPNAGGGYSGQDPDNFDMESKRLVGDSINERETNNSVPKQLTARAIDYCEITQVPDYINANERRLDPSLLGGLRSNPYSININPVRSLDAVNG